MQSLLFTNTFFEEELEQPLSSSITSYLEQHSIPLHLHFLSCLTTEKNETPLLAFIPDTEYLSLLEKWETPSPSYLHLPVKENTHLKSWGASTALSEWANKNQCVYEIPPLELVRQINSKAFSFEHGKKLPDSALIQNKEELLQFWQHVKGAKVLKSLHSSSGKGHFISKREELDLLGAEAFLSLHKEVLAEPWLSRILDFSSQWYIDKAGSYSYLGATICQNSPRGVYRKSLVGPEKLLFQEHLPFLEEHLSYAQEIIQKILSLSFKGTRFFGHLGIDAMIYQNQNKAILHPIVEVNARKTMGWAALKICSRINPNDIMSFHYSLKNIPGESLLPKTARTPEGKVFPFQSKLIVQKQDSLFHPT